MEWAGLVALALMLFYSSYPNKVKRLEKRIKKLEKKQRGEDYMSKLIDELVGKKCKIESDEDFVCHVLDADDEWMKISYTDKKNSQITKMLRIEDIDNIEIIEE